jgi:hypothetical protein
MAPCNNVAFSSGSLDPILDQSSPFFVHPCYGSSSISVTPVLNGSNFHSWARSMDRAPCGKMKFEFVDGTIPVVFVLSIHPFVHGIGATCL